MQDLWLALTDGRSDLFLYAVLPTVAVTLAYVSGSLLCLWLDHAPSLRAYKIQPQVHGRADWWRCVRSLLFSKTVAELPLTIVAYPIFIWLGVRKDVPLPGIGTVLITLAASFLIEDAWHYFAHRTLHTRWAFRKIHHLHHHYTTPFGVAATSPTGGDDLHRLRHGAAHPPPAPAPVGADPVDRRAPVAGGQRALRL